MVSTVLIGILLSLFAGLATGIGGAVAFFLKKPTKKMTVLLLGFAAGVMIGVSFLELLPSAINSIGPNYAIFSFLLGFAGIFAVDAIVPHRFIGEDCTKKEAKLMRASTLIYVGMAIHNFPEGFAIFASTMSSVKLGIVLAIAITLHNIPEGIAVSMPLCFANNNKKKGLKRAFIAGMAEPMGAIIGALILLPFLTDFVVEFSLALVAGIMVYISLDELLPIAHEYGEEHMVSLGLLLGMIIMAATILLL
ncbi:zinc transporter ZupT [Candidatus Undinarchaeota archaeon]